MQRIVVDVSVAIADPVGFADHGEARVCMHASVLDELSRLSRSGGDVGRSAVDALGELERLTQPDESGSNVRLELIDTEPATAPPAVAAGLGLAATGLKVLVVSTDPSVRVAARHCGLDADDHRPVVAIPEPEVGWHTIDAPGQVMNQLLQLKEVPVDGLPVSLTAVATNEFCMIRSGSQTVMARYTGRSLRVLPPDVTVWNLRSRTREQAFALDLLCDPDVPVVALSGRAGTGKTLSAVAAGLSGVINRDIYDRLTVYRPGSERRGPGQVDPSVFDAVTALTDGRSQAKAADHIAEWTANGALVCSTLDELDGRSLQRQFVIVDDAQNFGVSTLRTILSRVGDGTKIVFCGDSAQIEVPHLSEHTNALAVLRGAMRGQPEFGAVTLTSGERSRAAELSRTLLSGGHHG